MHNKLSTSYLMIKIEVMKKGMNKIIILVVLFLIANVYNLLLIIQEISNLLCLEQLNLFNSL